MKRTNIALMTTMLDAGAPSYANFKTVDVVPYTGYTGLSKIKNVAHFHTTFAPGFVPLATAQQGAVEFVQPNTEGHKLESIRPSGKRLEFDITEEFIPGRIVYQFEKGIRPELRALLGVP